MRILFLALLVFAPALPAIDSGEVTTRVQTVAEHALHKRYPDLETHLKVRVLRLSDGLKKGEIVKVAFPSKGAVPRAHTQVALLTNRGEKAGWALLYVAHYDSVVVTRDKVLRGEEVKAEAMQTAWTEVTNIHGAPLRPTALSTTDAPLYAVRSLQGGRVLRQSDVRQAFAVETGGAVSMRYRRGRIALDLAGKARQSGHVGDVIRLYAPETDSHYRARLTGEGTAVWIETL